MQYIPEKILFIDIETVSQYKNYEDAPLAIQKLWYKKYEKNEYLNTISVEQSYSDKAAIFSEYGKIICISIGMYSKSNDEFRIKSFSHHDEKILLKELIEFCSKLKKNYIFCGHNIKEFDIPYICRRLLINFLPIPSLLNFQDKKPWEVEIIDTMQLWKFGDYKNYTSLETLTTIFHIPTPKEDIDGSMVGNVYWGENNLERIVRYCENDVIALIQLYRSLHQHSLLAQDKFQIIAS